MDYLSLIIFIVILFFFLELSADNYYYYKQLFNNIGCKVTKGNQIKILEWIK